MSRTKTENILIRVTPTERKRIEAKMAELGIRNMSAYIRKMSLDGLCVQLDLKDIRDFTEQVSRIGNNLNQYAKLANTTGSIYAQDIAYLREQFAVLCDMEGKILAKLAAIR